MTKIYFANDLFNEATLMWNEAMASLIKHVFKNEVELYLPQHNKGINDKNTYADSRMIFHADRNKLKESDLLIAVLDLDDSGVALEVGLAYEMGIPTIGVYTDTRQQGWANPKKIEALTETGENQFSYTNLMVVGAIKDNGVMVNNSDDMVREIGKFLGQE